MKKITLHLEKNIHQQKGVQTIQFINRNTHTHCCKLLLNNYLSEMPSQEEDLGSGNQTMQEESMVKHSHKGTPAKCESIYVFNRGLIYFDAQNKKKQK